MVSTYRALNERALRKAERYLSKSCDVMTGLIAEHGPCNLAASGFRPFQTLAKSIIRQQLSAKAADTIERRILNIVTSFSPAELLSLPFNALRSAGLSYAKARYILELAQRVNDGDIDFDALMSRSDEDVIAVLTDLPGIGNWTAEMFLIFCLKRPDVLALGDAGLQRAARLLYGDTMNLEDRAKTWKPYRSVASWYLWRHLDAGQ